VRGDLEQLPVQGSVWRRRRGPPTEREGGKMDNEAETDEDGSSSAATCISR